MEDYRTYLAQQTLTEDKVVTYRLLSRALKVHVNTAKRMLYDFHKWQNDKRPGTLHATYLVYGVRGEESRDDDVDMTDSMSEPELPYSEAVPTYSLSLVKEEDLEDVLDQHTRIISYHVYSVAPHPLKDLRLLVDAAQQVLKLSADDSPESAKVYGTPINHDVRKRERRAGAPAPVPIARETKAVKPEPKPAPAASAKEEPKAQVKRETKPAKPATSKEEPKTASAPQKAAAVKRQTSGSGGIGQMFAKAAANPKKPKAAPTKVAAPSKASPAEAPSPALSDEGENDDTEMTDVRSGNDARNVKKDRQAALRSMMEESDDEEPEKADSPADEQMLEEAEPEPEPEPADEGPPEIVSTTGDGRRRGRRRVTKKKQIMDEQGYLVTIQEPGWESFSEEEAPAPKPKPKPAPKAAPAAKGKKGGKGAGAGQGNIMSFFAKK